MSGNVSGGEQYICKKIIYKHKSIKKKKKKKKNRMEQNTDIREKKK